MQSFVRSALVEKLTHSRRSPRRQRSRGWGTDRGACLYAETRPRSGSGCRHSRCRPSSVSDPEKRELFPLGKAPSLAGRRFMPIPSGDRAWADLLRPAIAVPHHL